MPSWKLEFKKKVQYYIELASLSPLVAASSTLKSQALYWQVVVVLVSP